MRIKRRTALCVAVVAACKVFVSIYRLARVADVRLGDKIQVTYTLDMGQHDGTWWKCHQ